MPRDVTTRWNSTYDMLSFALEYRKAIDILTADRRHGLRAYELSEREWTIASQLCDVLKVRNATIPQIALSSLITSRAGLEGCNTIFLPRNTQSCHRYPCYGLYQ
jgi:hypothetical protein